MKDVAIVVMFCILILMSNAVNSVQSRRLNDLENQVSDLNSAVNMLMKEHGK